MEWVLNGFNIRPAIGGQQMKPTGTIVVVGSANMDIVIPVSRLPAEGETIAGGDLAFFAGGKGANQACAAGRLGARVSMVAQVGSDPFGAALVSGLAEAGVDVRHVGASPRASGCASIYVLPDGQNSIVISAGANAALDPATALRRLDSIPDPAVVLLQLEIPVETVDAVLEWTRSRGVRAILDPAPARPLSPALLRKADILTPNQSEAAALSGRPSAVCDFDDAGQVAALHLQAGHAAVVMKLGALGCLVRTADRCQRVSGYRVTAVDTTAAGDAFNAALAVALSEGKPLVDAAVFANAAAALSVTRRGAQASLPYRPEVDCFVESATATA
jgi:ribokinase